MILKDKIQVLDLITGARFFGGATMYSDGKVISYINETRLLITNGDVEIEMFIPVEGGGVSFSDSTIHKIGKRLGEEFGLNMNDVTFESVKGSWLDVESDEVIVENIVLMKFKTNYGRITKVYDLAEEIKELFQQQAVSFLVNEQLIII